MALAPKASVNPTVTVTRPKPGQQILWPTCPGYGDNGGTDSSRFPSLSAIKARQSKRLPEALAAFVECAQTAQDRILVLDDFLFKPLEDQSQQSRYDQILNWLPDGLVANDIRFLTNSHEDEAGKTAIRKQFECRISEINQLSQRRIGLATIEIKFSLGKTFPYVHDRFAII